MHGFSMSHGLSMQNCRRPSIAHTHKHVHPTPAKTIMMHQHMFRLPIAMSVALLAVQDHIRDHKPHAKAP